MFFGLMLNAYVISSLTTALASMNSKQELTGKQLNLIKSHLVLKAVPTALRGRILEYYEYLLGSSAALDNMNMFDNLPPALSAQLALSTNRRLAMRCAFFNFVSNASLIALVEKFVAHVFIPEQTICREKLPLVAAYFINRGIVQMSSHEATHGTLTNNDNFGFDDYYHACVSKSAAYNSRSAQAVTYCDLMSLAIDALNTILEDDQTFVELLREAERRNSVGCSGKR
jgi:hypothetical protein